MPYEEFLGWESYFNMRPVGWRDDSRTYKLMRAWGIKERPESTFDSLARINRAAVPSVSEGGKISEEALRKSSFFGKILTAKGGDKLDL